MPLVLRTGVDIKELPNLTRWFKEIEARPAVQKGLNIPDPNKFGGNMSEEAVQVSNVLQHAALHGAVFHQKATDCQQYLCEPQQLIHKCACPPAENDRRGAQVHGQHGEEVMPALGSSLSCLQLYS